ncbi:MAG: hypothetical protein AAFX50_18130, partial [Acidobacteriota bacterium]
AGVAPREQALRSLKRSRPGRPPVYRDGDLYSLDPHSDELDLWVFRLDLRPPKVRPPAVEETPPPAEPVRGPDEPVTLDELEEAFTGTSLNTWSTQRLAILLVEASGASIHRAQAAAMLGGWTRYHSVSATYPNRWTHGAVQEDADGWWTLDPGLKQVATARRALRQLLIKVRAQRRGRRSEQERVDRAIALADERRERAAEVLEAQRRCLLFGYPLRKPQRVVHLDLASREMRFFGTSEFTALLAELEGYDWLGALDVRPLVASLGFEAGARELAELGPPQKTLAIPDGRPLKITAEAMVKGCSNVTKPLGDAKKMQSYLAQGKHQLLDRQLAKAMRSLFGLYHYCKLHGGFRIVRGRVEEWLRAPWLHRDERTLNDLKRLAFEGDLDIEASIGPALSIEDPWRDAVRLRSVPELSYGHCLIFENGFVVEESMILAARLVLREGDTAGPVH